MKQISVKYPQAFRDKKVSIKEAIKTLARQGITTDEDEAKVILDFLYLIAKTHSNPKPDNSKTLDLEWNSNT